MADGVWPALRRPPEWCGNVNRQGHKAASMAWHGGDEEARRRAAAEGSRLRRFVRRLLTKGDVFRRGVEALRDKLQTRPGDAVTGYDHIADRLTDLLGNPEGRYHTFVAINGWPERCRICDLHADASIHTGTVRFEEVCEEA